MILIENDFLLFIYLMILLVFVLFMGVLVKIISPKYWVLDEKLSTYECGFIPYSDISILLDTTLTVVAMSFLLLDIELLYMLPWSGVLGSCTILGYITMWFFYLLVSLSLVIEWNFNIF